ncbi:MAG: deaminase [Candidatus Saccharibacteria bacterium]|nr:deaminase [Candidatus Saccharibacteria bacterium]
MTQLTPEQQAKQIYYRDARTKGHYDKIWQSVGKCVFCDLRDKYIFHEENGIVMTVALFAYIDGNFMIVPRRHVRSVKELSEAEWLTVQKMMYIAKKIIKKAYGIKGLQFIVRDGGIEAQSTVSDHLHMHAIPFDAPDLSVWNYRELKLTPYENAERYRNHREDIESLGKKFDTKYGSKTKQKVDAKALYREALKQALTEKKESKAVKTAKVGAAVIAGSNVFARANANLVNDTMDVQKDDGIWTSPPTVAHAEEQCVAYAAATGISLKGSTMIVTLSPCMTCSRLIVSAGVKEVHYIDDWWDTQALDFLRAKGIKVVKLKRMKKEKRP